MIYMATSIGEAVLLLVVLILLSVLVVPLQNQQGDKEPEKAICTSQTCINEAYQIAQQIDRRVNPCENFHKFACKKDSLQDLTTTLKMDVARQMIQLYKNPIKHDDHIMVKSVKKLYKTCVKEAFENSVAKNIRIIKQDLKKAGGWPLLEGSKWDETKFDWLQATYKFRRLGYHHEVFLDLSIMSIPTHQRKFIVVSLPKLSVIEKGPAVEVAVLLGASRHLTSDAIDEINNYIMQLHQNDTCQHIKRYVLTSPEDYQKKQGFTISWLEIINKIVAPAANISKNSIILILDPEIMTNGLQLLSKTPKRILANYMMWKVVMEIAPDVLVDSPEKHFVAKLPSKIATQEEVGCLNQIEKSLRSIPNPIHILYVNKYLPVNKRTIVKEMANNIKGAFLDLLERADWTNEEDKQDIMKYAKEITMTIGAPESYFDKKIFDLINADMEKADKDDFLSLMLQIRRNYASLAYKQFNNSPREVESLLWNMMDVTNRVLATDVLFQKLDKIEIPATILQGPLFNENRPNYLNYGHLGSFISTQLAAQFTELFTGKGMLNKIQLNFGKVKTCVRNDIKVSYKVCTTAGNANLCKIVEDWDFCLWHTSLSRSTAYMAYNKWTKSNGIEPTLSNSDYTNQQLFWISAMSSHCQAIDAEIGISVAVECNKAILTEDFNCYYF